MKNIIFAIMIITVLLIYPKTVISQNIENIETLTKNSDLIIRGEVSLLECQKNLKTNLIETHATISNITVIKGKTNKSQIIVKVIGGKIGKKRLTALGSATFNTQEKVLLFLTTPKNDDSYYITGLAKGKILLGDKLEDDDYSIQADPSIFRDIKTVRPSEIKKLSQILTLIQEILK